MDIAGFIVALAAVCLLILAGGSCLVSKDRSTTLGVLNGCLGCGLLVAAILLRSGALVLAPEFGMVMVQGSGATWFLRLALIALGGLAPLSALRVCQINLRPQRLWPAVCTGLAVGTWASFRVILVNPADFESLQIRSYDVWWPGLTTWLIVCWVATLLALAQVNDRLRRITFTAALLAPTAHFALVHQELSDPGSRTLWHVIEAASALLALVPWLYLAALPWLKHWRSQRVRLAVAALASIALAVWYLFGGSRIRLVFDCIPISLLLGVLLLALCGKFITRTAGPRSDLRWVRLLRWHLRHFHLRRPGIIPAVLLLLTLPPLLIDLFSLGSGSRDWELALLALFWLVFSTTLARRALDRLAGDVWYGQWPFSPETREQMATWFQRKPDPATGAQPLATADAKEPPAGAWAVALRGVIITFAGLVALIAVGEMMNYRKLVVEPFVWKGEAGEVQIEPSRPAAAEAGRKGGTLDSKAKPKSEADDKADPKPAEKKSQVARSGDKIAELFSAGVVNSLGKMRHDLMPVLLAESTTGSHPGKPSSVILDNGAMQAAIGKSTDINVGSVTIPVSILAEPIQRVVRGLFGIRVIGGSLHQSSDGKRYVVLINSGEGDTWRISEKTPEEQQAEDDAKLLETATAARPEGSVAQVSEPDPDLEHKPICEVPDDTGDNFEAMVDEAAFYIANSDPSFSAMGLTRDWKAYTKFHNGLRSWNCYQAYHHQSDLDEAIEQFRRAVHQDSTFAPAQYRLGLALQSAGDTDAAIQAFEDTYNSNSSLILARTAEAQTLWKTQYTYDYRPAIAAAVDPQNRSGEARKILASTLDASLDRASPIDLRATYFYLCADRVPNDWGDQLERSPRTYYVNYFFCARSEALYLQLPPADREDDQQKKLEAQLLYWFGEVLSYHGRFYDPVEIQNDPRYRLAEDPGRFARRVPVPFGSGSRPLWICSASAIEWPDLLANERPTYFVLRGSNLMAHALRYFRASLALQPSDDNIRCEAAMAQAFVAPDADPRLAMRALEQSSSAHLYKGYDFYLQGLRVSRAVQDIPLGADYMQRSRLMRLAQDYYALAIETDKEAIDLAPASTDALSQYGGAVWQWHLDAVNNLTIGIPNYWAEVQQRDKDAKFGQIMPAPTNPAARLQWERDIRTGLRRPPPEDPIARFQWAQDMNFMSSDPAPPPSRHAAFSQWVKDMQLQSMAPPQDPHDRDQWKLDLESSLHNPAPADARAAQQWRLDRQAYAYNPPPLDSESLAQWIIDMQRAISAPEPRDKSAYAQWKLDIKNGARADPPADPVARQQWELDIEDALRNPPPPPDRAEELTQWKLDMENGVTNPWPYDIVALAESASREGIRLAKMRRDPTGAQWAQDSLAEVLLVSGRSDEAIYQLHQGLKFEPDFTGRNEMKWDLAQALLCSSQPGVKATGKDSPDEEVSRLYAAIKLDELRHENRPFTNTPGSFDAVTNRSRCVPPIDMDGYFPLKLVNVEYKDQASCSALIRVSAWLRDQGAPVPINVGVLGGETTSPSFGSAVQIIQPIREPRIYFVYASIPKNPGGTSRAFPLDLNRKSGGACPYGRVSQVLLTFEISNGR